MHSRHNNEGRSHSAEHEEGSFREATLCSICTGVIVSLVYQCRAQRFTAVCSCLYKATVSQSHCSSC
jgi:hypothetical protein